MRGSRRVAQQLHASISGFAPPTHQPPAPRAVGAGGAGLRLELDAVAVGGQPPPARRDREDQCRDGGRHKHGGAGAGRHERNAPQARTRRMLVQSGSLGQ